MLIVETLPSTSELNDVDMGMGGGVNKIIFFVSLFSLFFRSTKTLITNAIPRACLTGVSAAAMTPVKYERDKKT